jgi:hypothetical protein
MRTVPTPSFSVFHYKSHTQHSHPPLPLLHQSDPLQHNIKPKSICPVMPSEHDSHSSGSSEPANFTRESEVPGNSIASFSNVTQLYGGNPGDTFRHSFFRTAPFQISYVGSPHIQDRSKPQQKGTQGSFCANCINNEPPTDITQRLNPDKAPSNGTATPTSTVVGVVPASYHARGTWEIPESWRAGRQDKVTLHPPEHRTSGATFEMQIDSQTGRKSIVPFVSKFSFKNGQTMIKKVPFFDENSVQVVDTLPFGYDSERWFAGEAVGSMMEFDRSNQGRRGRMAISDPVPAGTREKFLLGLM